MKVLAFLAGAEFIFYLGGAETNYKVDYQLVDDSLLAGCEVLFVWLLQTQWHDYTLIRIRLSWGKQIPSTITSSFVEVFEIYFFE